MPVSQGNNTCCVLALFHKCFINLCLKNFRNQCQQSIQAMFPDSQRQKRTSTLHLTGYKTWPCCQLICIAELIICDDARYFSVRAPFSLSKQDDVIGRPAITVTDRVPGGRSAEAKILSVSGRGRQSEFLNRWEEKQYIMSKEHAFFSPIV